MTLSLGRSPDRFAPAPAASALRSAAPRVAPLPRVGREPEAPFSLLDLGASVALAVALLSLFGGSLELGWETLRLSVHDPWRPALLWLLLRGATARRDRHRRSEPPNGFGALAAVPPAVARPAPSSGKWSSVVRGGALLLAAAAMAAPFLPALAPRGARFELAAAILFGELAAAGRAGRAASRRLRFDLAAVALLGLHLIFAGTPRVLTSGDNLATRWIPQALAENGSLDLTGLGPWAANPGHYSAIRVGDRLLPAFPIGTALLSLPVLTIAAATTDAPPSDRFLQRWEKRTAALLATASAALLFLALRRRFGDRAAALVALLFALATPVFSTAAQGLWSVSGELLFLNLALALLLGSDRPAAAALAGLTLGGAFLCRPTAVLALAPLAAVAWLESRRRGLALLGAAAGSIAAVAAVQGSIWGHPLGGYGLLNREAAGWGSHPLEGLAGVLLSPSRGLLLFCPFVLLVPFVRRRLASRPELHPLWFASLAIVAAITLLAAAYAKWWGGHSIGPRLLAEAAPFLALLLLPLFVGEQLPRRQLVPLVAAIALSVATQLLAGYRPGAMAWNPIADPDHHPERLWSIGDSQMAAIWLPGWRPTGTSRYLRPAPPNEAARFVPVDLSPAANARWDLDPFDPAAPPDAFPHFPRLRPSEVAAASSPFRIAAAGKANCLTTGRNARPAPLRLPPTPASVIHLLVSAGATGGLPSGATVSTLVVRFGDGSVRRLPLRLDAEVFEYHRRQRTAAVPEGRVWGGTADDSDLLVRTVLPLGDAPAPVVEISLEGPGDGSGAGVAVVGIALER